MRIRWHRLFALSLLATACKGEPADTADTGGVACDEITTWSTVGAPFIYTWCTPCHSPELTGEERQGAPVGVDFASYEDVLAWADRIEVRVFAEEAAMPPAGGPEDDELAAVSDWIGCGWPE